MSSSLAAFRWLILVVLCASRPLGHTLKEVAKFDLPGPGGKRFDYLTIDPDDQYLISAHLGADQTYVIDLRTNKVLATVKDTPGAEGVEYVPELKKFYTSNAHDNTIGVVDLKQMKVIKKLKTEAKPDGSAYAAPFHKLYVSDERGQAEAIVDVQKDEIVRTLHFDSETGMPQYDRVSRKVYVNLQDQNIFAVIDPATKQPVPHGARNVWVTETALATALNTSFMAQQLGNFGIVVGIALLLSGFGFLILAAGGALRTGAWFFGLRSAAPKTKPVVAA